MYGRKRPALPSTELLRPMTVAVDYGSRVALASSPRSTSVPPSLSGGHATAVPQHRLQPVRRLSATSSVSDLRSTALSTVCRSSYVATVRRHDTVVEQSQMYKFINHNRVQLPKLSVDSSMIAQRPNSFKCLAMS